MGDWNRPQKNIMEDFRKIFTGLERAHGCTYVDKKGADGLKVKGKSFVKREPVTEELWQNHLNGIEPSLGIIPIDEENKCRWGCIDVDKYTLDHKEIIHRCLNLEEVTICKQLFKRFFTGLLRRRRENVDISRAYKRNFN